MLGTSRKLRSKNKRLRLFLSEQILACMFRHLGVCSEPSYNVFYRKDDDNIGKRGEMS